IPYFPPFKFCILSFAVNCLFMEKKKIISVKNLVKNYGSFEAVKGISFDVFEHEIFGMLGPNGAGKSTTLEIIETLRGKTRGEVIKNIRERGTTVIITTHYMDEAEYLCDRVAVIDAGKIIELNSPDQMIDQLVASGFERPREVKKANLEDVFIHLTGRSLREE